MLVSSVNASSYLRNAVKSNSGDAMRLVRYLLFATVMVTCLILGLWSVRIEAENRVEPISLCEAIENQYVYHGLTLKISASMSGKFVHDKRCGNEDGEWAEIKLLDQPEFDDLKNELRTLNSAYSFAKSDVIVLGTFQHVGENCVSLPHAIVNARILSARPVEATLVK
jgi:hypothetical protein